MIAGAVSAKTRERVDEGGDEADVGGAAFQRVKRRHFGQAQVPVHGVEPNEQRAIAVGRRHRRIAAGVEGNGR